MTVAARLARAPGRRHAPAPSRPAATAAGALPVIVPAEYGVLGAGLVALAAFAAGYGARTLGAAVVACALTVAFSFLRRAPLRLLLVDVWVAAFAYLHLSDLVLTADGVVTTFGAEVASDAEAFLVGSLGASLVGAAAFERLARRRAASRLLPRPAGGRAVHVPATLALVLAVATALVLVFVLWIVTPTELFATARGQRSFADTASRPLFIAALVMQPILTAYVTRRHRERGPLLLAAWAVTPIAALALYASGTRFYLGFMLSGVLYYVLQPLRPMSGRRCAAIAGAALAFLALQGAMRVSRTVGLVELDPSRVLDALAEPETFLSSEGLLRVNAWVHEKQAWRDPRRPFENGFILYWWVPRAVWPDKPAMEGRRLIDDVMDEGYFNPNHSVAGGFAMPALLDFGPWLGLACAALYGAGLAWLSRFAARHASPFDPASPIVALLPFGVFFAARGLHTSLIFMSLCMLWCAPVVWLERRRRVRVVALSPYRVPGARRVLPRLRRGAYA